MSHVCHRFWKCHKNLTFCSLLTRCTIPCTCHAKAHLNVQKCSVPVSFFALLTSTCASRHNGVHFCDISTSVCFVHFDFEMCFTPQRRALFRHLKCQKWSANSAPGVFCAFWLGNVLRATTACTFSTSQLPKVVRGWGVLGILTWKCASRHNGVQFFDISTSKSAPRMVCFVHLTWKCASRHNGVQFFISHLARWLRTRRFSEPSCRPSGDTNHWKNTLFRDFSTFLRTCIFLVTLSLLWSSLFFSSHLWLFPPLLFHLSILSEVWLLNFLRLHHHDLKFAEYIQPNILPASQMVFSFFVSQIKLKHV